MVPTYIIAARTVFVNTFYHIFQKNRPKTKHFAQQKHFYIVKNLSTVFAVPNVKIINLTICLFL